VPVIRKFPLSLSLGFGGEGGVRGLLADDFYATFRFTHNKRTKDIIALKARVFYSFFPSLTFSMAAVIYG